MTTALKSFLLFLLLSFAFSIHASNSSWYTLSASHKVQLNVDLFLSSTCKFCHKADEYFKSIESSTPWLHVKRYIINQDKQALISFNQLLTQQNSSDFSVPAVFFCNSRWIGFDSAQTTGQELLHALEYCKQQIEQKGELTLPTVDVLTRKANAHFFNSNMVEKPSPIRYITTMALLDAVSPCSAFGFVAFFALLGLQNDKKKQFVNGCLFIFLSGLVHYVQQAFSSSFFELLPWMRIPVACIGFYLIYLAILCYRQKETYTNLLMMTLFVALLVHGYQQTCVMNWANIFEQWLTNQSLSSDQFLTYQLAYQVNYLIPLFIVLCAFLLLIRNQPGSSWGQFAHIFGVLFISVIGGLLIIYPLALASFSLSFLFIGLTVLGAWLIYYYTIKNVS